MRRGPPKREGSPKQESGAGGMRWYKISLMLISEVKVKKNVKPKKW